MFSEKIEANRNLKHRGVHDTELTKLLRNELIRRKIRQLKFLINIPSQPEALCSLFHMVIEKLQKQQRLNWERSKQHRKGFDIF